MRSWRGGTCELREPRFRELEPPPRNNDKADRGSALKPVVWIELLSCADGLDPLAQAGFVAAGGVLVQDALLDTLVHRGGGGAEGRLGGVFVALGNSLAHRA